MSEEDGSSSSKVGAFKLTALETARADPLLEPIDHSLLGAYMSFMKWPARSAYLTNLKARVLTGMRSEPTISASRARLAKTGYLRLVMTKLNGAEVYEIKNPRAQIVADHIVIAEETLKEKDAFRKTEERRKRALKSGSIKKTYAPSLPFDQSECRDSTKKSYDNSLEYTLEGRASKEGLFYQDPFNSYAKASGGC